MLLTRMRAEDEQPNLREATLPTFTSKLRKPNAPTAASNQGNVNNSSNNRRGNGSRSNTHHRLPSGPSPPLLRPAASTSTSANSSTPIPTGPKGGRHPWNGREDSVLIASVQQHGQDWSKVQAALQAAGAPPRACGAIAQRYFRLSRQAVRQQERTSAASSSPSGALGTGSASTPATAASSSTPQQQQQPTLASLQTASSDLNKARSKQTMVPWTSEEDRILVLAAEAAKQHKDIWPLFCKSLPLTTRTASAVETRWNQFLRPEGRRKRNRSRSKTGDSGGNAGNGDQRQPGSVASTLSGTEPPQGPAAATPPLLPQATAGEGSNEANNEAAAAATLASMTQDAALQQAQQEVDAVFDSFEGADFAQEVNEDDASMTTLQQADIAATTESPRVVGQVLVEATPLQQDSLAKSGEDAVAASAVHRSHEGAAAEHAQSPTDVQAEDDPNQHNDSAIVIEDSEFLTPPLRQMDVPPAAGLDQPAINAQGPTPVHPHDDSSINDANEDAAVAASPQQLSATAEPPQEVEDDPIDEALHNHHDTTYTPTHQLEDDSHQVATLPSPPSATAPLPPLHDRVTPALNYTIDYLPNGFFIRNFPPHHELHIHSPTSCQVIKPERAALPQLERLIQQQQLEQPYTAPFIFRAGSSGFIQALALPPGTERSVELVSLAGDDVEEEEGEEGGAGGRGGNEGQARFIESRFDAPDGYCVRFESQLRG